MTAEKIAESFIFLFFRTYVMGFIKEIRHKVKLQITRIAVHRTIDTCLPECENLRRQQQEWRADYGENYFRVFESRREEGHFFILTVTSWRHSLAVVMSNHSDYCVGVYYKESYKGRNGCQQIKWKVNMSATWPRKTNYFYLRLRYDVHEDREKIQQTLITTFAVTSYAGHSATTVELSPRISMWCLCMQGRIKGPKPRGVHAGMGGGG